MASSMSGWLGSGDTILPSTLESSRDGDEDNGYINEKRGKYIDCRCVS